MSLVPIEAVGAIAPMNGLAMASPPTSTPRGSSSFGQLLLNGINQVDQQLTTADNLAAAFAVDDTIPPHQVTVALEQARLSLELLLQVRSHLVEGYQEIMRMQL